MPSRIRLSFASITCARCGGVRLMTQACPECGLQPRPHETQPDLERRRKILAAFEANESTQPRTISGDVDAAIDDIPVILESINRALAAAARGGRSPRGLIDAFAQLDAQVSHWSRRHPRPNTNRARSLGRSLRLLRQGFREFANALGAPTMLEAQAREADGQRLLDAAAAEIAALGEIADSELLLDAPDGLGRIGASARAVAGGEGALDTLDGRLQGLVRPGRESFSVGLGLHLHLFRQIMLVSLDLEECLEVARVAEDHMDNVVAVCEDPRWQARHGVVTAQFSSVSHSLSTLEESTDLETVGAALQLVMQCRDGVIRHCLATLLAEHPDDYERLTLQGAGQVIKQAAQKYPGLRLDQNLSQTLRHAGAHYDYDVDDAFFITHSASGVELRLTSDEFVDQVLGYVQSSISLLVAVVSAALTRDVELEISKHTPERDLLGAMATLLGFVGYSDVSTSRKDDTLQITVQGEASKFSTAAAGIAAIAPEQIQKITALISEDDGSCRLWEASMDPFRNYLQRPTDLPEGEEVIALASVMSAVSMDSRPLWNEDMWASIANLLLNATCDLSLRDQVIQVRQLRDLAENNAQHQIAEVLSGVLRTLRSGRSDSKQPPATFQRQDPLKGSPLSSRPPSID